MTTLTPKTTTNSTSANVAAGLPAAVPAAVLARKAQPATSATPGKNVHNFAAWKGALGTAQSATGYDTTSPIYGRTDIEVLTGMKDHLETTRTGAINDGSILAGSLLADALQDSVTLIEELLKRKVAKQIAGQTYKSRKTI